jgi:serine protease inhibitor ecotin
MFFSKDKLCHKLNPGIRSSGQNFSDQLLRYNSKLPLVVYEPSGFEVRYRIWAAGEEAQQAIAE